jgi:hypothetical protein
VELAATVTVVRPVVNELLVARSISKPVSLVLRLVRWIEETGDSFPLPADL